MKTLSAENAWKVWNDLSERYSYDKNSVEMIRDSWQDGYSVTFKDSKYTVTRIVSYEVSTFSGKEN